MSLSRAELDAMEKDELIDTVIALSERVDDQQARLEAMSRWKEATNARLDEIQDENERVRAENQDLRQRLDAIEAKAEQAMTVAGNETDSGGGRGKIDVAKDITRNTLVTRAAKNGGQLGITVSEVREKAEHRGHDLKWQTVRDAWDSLKEEWPQFYDTTTDGAQALSVRKSDVTKALARRVEVDLERDDLTKSLVGQNGGGGS